MPEDERWVNIQLNDGQDVLFPNPIGQYVLPPTGESVFISIATPKGMFTVEIEPDGTVTLG